MEGKTLRAYDSNIFYLKVHPDEAIFSLEIDESFLNQPIALEPGGLLINQGATTDDWGSPAGKHPEEFLKGYPHGSICFHPNHFGWQLGSFLILDGVFIPLQNEAKIIRGRFNVIGLINGKWTSLEIPISKGKVLTDITNIKIGLSMPLIVKSGKIISLNDIIGDWRFRADYRNIFDFGFGKGPQLPSQYWLLIRKLLPTTEEQAKSLLAGKRIITSTDALTEEEFKTLVQIINSELSDYLRISRYGNRTLLTILTKPPFTKLPITSVGYDKDGNLIVAAVDGRQEGSVGVTISQLAEIMKGLGVVAAGFGPAGGDVALVHKLEFLGYKVINKPSNPEHKTRPCPSVLVISPK